jgi:hypothetical protein
LSILEFDDIVQFSNQGILMTIESDAYAKHKNLKLAADEIGIKWQTLYCRLKSQNVAVTGDKLRYGTDRDRLGAYGEQLFQSIVPFAKNTNNNQFQSKVDFDVNGLKVDIKAGLPRQLNKKFAALSWSFSFKRQTLHADFIVCFCLDELKEIEHILLVPKEFFIGLQTVSVSRKGFSKWLDYKVNADDLKEFFSNF